MVYVLRGESILLRNEQCFQYNKLIKEHQLYLYPILSSKIYRLLGNTPKKILDLGVGPGYLSFCLAKLFSKSDIIALDINPHMIELSKDNERFWNKTNNKINYVEGDVHNLNFPDNMFDLIVSYSCFHHWFDIKQSLLEIIRVLNKEGTAILIDTNPDKLQINSDLLSFLNYNDEYIYFIEKAWRESIKKEDISKLISEMFLPNCIYSLKDYTIEIEDIIFAEETFEESWLNGIGKKTFSSFPTSWIIIIKKI